MKLYDRLTNWATPTDGVVVRNLKYVALDGIWAVPILVVLCLCWNH